MLKINIGIVVYIRIIMTSVRDVTTASVVH